MANSSREIRAENGSIVNTGEVRGSRLSATGGQRESDKSRSEGREESQGRLWLMLSAVVAALGAIFAAVLQILFG